MEDWKGSGVKNIIRKSFRRKLMACFLAAALIPLILCCFCFIQVIRVKLKRDMERKDIEQELMAEQELISLFDGLEEVLTALSEDEEIRSGLESWGTGSQTGIYGQLYAETGAYREMAQFDLYSSEGECRYSTGAGSVHQNLPVYWGILKVAAAHPDDVIIRGVREYGGEEEILLRAVKAVRNREEECIGFLSAGMTAEDFEQVLQGIYGSQEGICILDRFCEPVYSAGTAARMDIGTVLRGKRMMGEALKEMESYQDNCIRISPIGDTGLYKVLLRPEILTAGVVRTMYSVLLLMAALCFFLCIAASAAMSRNLTRPIMRLNQAMEAVQGGNLETQLPGGRVDELGQLFDKFNVMTRELKGYMERQVSQQKKLNEVSIAMMQAQLNPHFLYNTLDTIKWVAKANHIPEIAALAAKLAKILRTSISRAQFITLREEIQMVECYVEIQQIRFSGKFHFAYELPEELAGQMVPKLVIQPVVENAVLHGLADCEEGHILVRVEKRPSVKKPGAQESGSLLCIEVEDDGCGIAQEVIEHLKNRDWDQMTGHIGFYNVDMIVRLHYGEEYGLRAERLETGGTRVTIVLPGPE